MENIVRESGEMDSIIDCDWRCDRCHRQCICESDHVGNGLRMGHMWMVYLLPFAGLMIVFLYHVTGQEKNAGTDMVLMVVRSDQNTMPGRVAPLI